MEKMTLREEADILSQEYNELPLEERERLEPEPVCDNCWFCVNRECQRIGGCRFD